MKIKPESVFVVIVFALLGYFVAKFFRTLIQNQSCSSFIPSGFVAFSWQYLPAMRNGVWICLAH